MKAHAITPGDRSVGIRPGLLTVELNCPHLSDTEREEFKALVANLTEDWFMERCRVYMDDECSECGSRLTGGKCNLKNCITNCDRELEEPEPIPMKSIWHDLRQGIRLACGFVGWLMRT